MTKAIVLLSGGIDSTVCLYLAKREYPHVKALFFDYDQLAVRSEWGATVRIAQMARVPLERIALGSIMRGASALIDPAIPVEKGEAPADGHTDAAFVPGRNAIFLAIAASHAYADDAEAIFIGCLGASGFPDCSRGFLQSMDMALQLGLGRRIAICAPLLNQQKAAVIRVAKGLHGCLDALAYSYSCYDGIGVPCGECHPCRARAEAFAANGIPDPADVLQVANQKSG